MTDGGYANTLGGTLRAARKAKGLTKADAAKQLGIGRRSLAAWEGGNARPGLNLLAKAAHVYGVDFAGLVVLP